MIVSWNWLKDYVDLKMTPDELAERLAMCGLNHEGTQRLGQDWAIDLEVTSNRPDCLGHIGVAREVSVLWDKPLSLPPVDLQESSIPASDLVGVRIDCPELCSRYTARVIRGVKVGPSPRWLAERLEALGIAVISNIVDITNYVMMECGQPLHAFDLAKLHGSQIIVRRASHQEPFTAIDHREYALEKDMCVIADTDRPVALAGVMGGADTEVSPSTTDVLIESADFAPLSVRSTSRALRLHSPSSYRFERGVDPQGVDWASRRACRLIQEMAGGEIAAGVVDAQAVSRCVAEPIVLRFSQLPRVLGIELTPGRVEKILNALGLKTETSDAKSLTVAAPSWRRDLTREIDLIEEVARIHGYDQIPEDVGVPMVPSYRQPRHRVLTTVRHVLTAAGFHEAMTASVVDEHASGCFSPWTQRPPLRSSTPMLRGADCLRRSVVPSLLESRRINESLANELIELFETAKVYLAPESGKGLPDEFWVLGLTSGRDFRTVKGVLEAILETLHVTQPLRTNRFESDFLAPGQRCELRLGDRQLGFLGGLSRQGRKSMGLRRESVVAEIRLDVLQQFSALVPQYQTLSQYPAISHDLNFVVPESVRWAELETSVIDGAGPLLESVDYRETYRDPKADGAGRKRLLLSVRLRSHSGTLTSDEADTVRQSIIAACERHHSAKLLG